jgi:CDP-diacylglycerol---glycerol-3-phosphate 3-phosphatidyltransferase
LNLPNALTLLRVLLIPVFILFLSSYTPFNLPLSTRAIAATGIFFIASTTDWLDGYIARRTGQITKLGKLFDPIADKLLTSSALILLVSLHGQVPAWIVIVIIGREFAVTGLRAAASSEGYVIPAAEGGKAKMVFQTIAIIALLLDLGVKFMYLDLFWVGIVSLWISMLLAVISGVQYFVEYWDKIGLSGEGGQ